MEVREIKALLALMQQYGLVELEIEDKKKGKIRLVRGGHTMPDAAALNHAPIAAQHTPTPVTLVPAPTRPRSSAAPEPPTLAEGQRFVTSPMVGTFYRAASPDGNPFVEEGAAVRKGQPVCIIEAMKMMNEIEADVAGRVVKILCENAQPVEYGQPLIVVEVA
jgi:acetyl-CoA carboxylase biotin carboxyl carrier protein